MVCLRLSEFDLTIAYWPGLVYHVLNALLRLLTSRRVDPTEVDGEVPTFGDVQPVLITTKSASMQEWMRSAQLELQSKGCDSIPEGWEDAVLDDTLDEELETFDVELAREDDDPERANPRPTVEGPLAITIDELVESQKNNEFCKTVLARQSLFHDSAFFKDRQGILPRRQPGYKVLTQIVVSETLQLHLLRQSHSSKMAGHPGQTRMYESLRRLYYWPHISEDINATIKNRLACARNR